MTSQINSLLRDNFIVEVKSNPYLIVGSYMIEINKKSVVRLDAAATAIATPILLIDGLIKPFNMLRITRYVVLFKYDN